MRAGRADPVRLAGDGAHRGDGWPDRPGSPGEGRPMAARGLDDRPRRPPRAGDLRGPMDAHSRRGAPFPKESVRLRAEQLLVDPTRRAQPVLLSAPARSLAVARHGPRGAVRIARAVPPVALSRDPRPRPGRGGGPDEAACQPGP